MSGRAGSRRDKTGRTQLRISFDLPTDGDGVADRLGFWTAEAAPESRPRLVVHYLLP